jgi:hypothetical protein
VGDRHLAYRHVQLPTDREATARRIRRFKRVRNQLLTDRGGDPTQAQQVLADNASALAVWLEEAAGQMMQGVSQDLSQINGSMNTLRRLLETLGIERKPRDITTLEQYIDRTTNEPPSSN